MFENVGGAEVLVIFVIALIFFGPKKIPELAASLGKGLRKFNDAKQGIESQVKTAMKEPLEALAGTKGDLEAKLREAAEPLHAELKVPAPLPQPLPPAVPPVPETFARGALIDPPENAASAPLPPEPPAPPTPPSIPTREA